jgi:hypothetical protein
MVSIFNPSETRKGIYFCDNEARGRSGVDPQSMRLAPSLTGVFRLIPFASSMLRIVWDDGGRHSVLVGDDGVRLFLPAYSGQFESLMFVQRT